MNPKTKISEKTIRPRNFKAGGPKPPPRPFVSIIGAGRLGSALGLALKAAGYKIEVVAARRPAAARRAATLFGSKTLTITSRQLNNLDEHQQARLDRCSIVLIATPDDAIEPTARQLSVVLKRDGERRRAARRIVLHTSGALSSEVLKPMRGAGFAIGSLHPLISVSDPDSGARSFKNAFFSVEGDAAAVKFAKTIVRVVAGESFKVNSDQKALYHAAAVMASPHVTALFDIALEMLGACGLPAPQASRVLLPLLVSTVTNLHTQDATAALTGTFKRGDVATARKHLAALRAVNLPAALAAYILLGQRSVEIAKRRKTTAGDLDELASLLSRAATKLS
jgi:predicted short-subunit dehydrogenase-like oxidoreductase (DUF2520 family)